MVSIVIPTFNEEENITDIYFEIAKIFSNEMSEYSYELIFVDNYSTDSTRRIIREICEKDERVKAIFYSRNFGFSKSVFYGLQQAKGECAILIFADMQDPPNIIPQFFKYWEEGFKAVIGIKEDSDESKLMYNIRSFFYKIQDKVAKIKTIQHFDGFGLYDSSIIEIMRKIDDPLPYLRGFLPEICSNYKKISYHQERRKKGKTSFNLVTYIDIALLGLTSYGNLMRLCIYIGGLFASICVILGIVTLIIKLLNWSYYSVGFAALLIGIFFTGGIQIMFMGIIGEYINNINIRVMRHPMVIEEERINMEIK